MNNALMQKLLTNSSIKGSSVLKTSESFSDYEMVSTGIPILDLAFSGKVNGGFIGVVNLIAGKSKHFKSLLGLLCIRAYLKKYPDAVCLFYDSEFGSVPSYWADMGIDTERVIHNPVMHVEQLKFDVVKQLELLKKGDKVIIFIDSVGNLASKKEVEDALSEKSVADLSRAKAMKSLWRIVTPLINDKRIPTFAVCHTYDTMELYSKQILSGGTGQYYAAGNIFIMGRSQQKDGDELTGYNFTINIEKSRYVIEKSQLPLEVSFEGGISKYSGLFDLAIEAGYVVAPTKGWYSRSSLDKATGELKPEDRKWRRADCIHSDEFFGPIMSNPDFINWLEQKYKMSGKAIMQDEAKPELLQEGDD